jgi:transketolase
MRTAFIETLMEYASKDKRINLVVADLGFSVIEPFANRFPDQFLNVGVAEQNMAGIAAGLSKIGNRKIFTYSIANFPILRCLEQVRNDICLNEADVKIVSVGAGVTYGKLGYSHFAVEDLSIMRSLPNIVVASPSDPFEAEACVRLACVSDGPWYIRLGKTGEPKIHPNKLDNLMIGDPIPLNNNGEGVLFVTGGILHEAMKAVQILKLEGVEVQLVSVPFIKPVKEEKIIGLCEGKKWVLTLEEHFRTGGLGSLVAEILADHRMSLPLHRLYLKEEAIHDVGSQEYIRSRSGIDQEGIVRMLRSLRNG